MPRAYIAGPMSGKEGFNYTAFHTAAYQLRSWGIDVLNPAESFNGRCDLPYDWYLREAIRLVSICDELYLLGGWQLSKGALLELHTALALGLRVYYLEPGGTILQSHLTLSDMPDLLKIKERYESVFGSIQWEDEGGQDDPGEPFVIEVGYTAGQPRETLEGDSFPTRVGG